MSVSCSVCTIFLFIFALLLLFVVFKHLRNWNFNVRRKVVNTVLVLLGSGGHTGEMCVLLNSLDPKKFDFFHFVIADTDKTSKPSAMVKVKPEIIQSKRSEWVKIPRSREVKQSYFTSIFSTLWSLFYITFITYPKILPELLLLNGPGTCVPIVFAARFYRLLGFRNRIIYTESMCRTERLSITGRIVYRFVDRFIVQWESLLEKYPKAEYIGRLC